MYSCDPTTGAGIYGVLRENPKEAQRRCSDYGPGNHDAERGQFAGMIILLESPE